MTLRYQRFTTVFLLIYGNLFVSGICYCLRVFWCENVGAWIRAAKFIATKQITVLEYRACSPDLPPVTFLNPKIKEILKGRHFDDMDDIRSNKRQLWRPFHKTSSKIVLKGGLGAGIGAWLPKGSTLKATTVIFNNEVCNTFTAMSSRTLLSDHVRIKWVCFLVNVHSVAC